MICIASASGKNQSAISSLIPLQLVTNVRVHD